MPWTKCFRIWDPANRALHLIPPTHVGYNIMTDSWRLGPTGLGAHLRLTWENAHVCTPAPLGVHIPFV